MKLVLDFGNTLAKIAVFRGNELLTFDSHKNFSTIEIISILNKFPSIKSSILCSVIENDPQILELLQKKTDFFELTEKTPVPIKNNYMQPESLGKDRLANAIGANSIFPSENVLVIDSGTCIKYDLVNSGNEYEGGAISPGLNMRYTALHELTAKLPLLKASSKTLLVGKTTGESITSGVQNGIVAEAEGMINNFSLKYPGLKIVLTGGDMIFFKDHLSEKNSIFADPYLLMKGLNTILDYNTKR